jgi:diadenosine tetraphosphate (Ap4A) HIT family hydrolase
MALEHWAKFRPSELTCREFSSWLVVVRQKQVTLGDCVFLVKRAVSSISEMTPGELAELAEVTGWFETVAKATYGAERFNYVAAMMKDPYVHFHAFPRYSGPIQRYDIEWRDEAWPKVIEFTDVTTPDNVLKAIREDLESAQ